MASQIEGSQSPLSSIIIYRSQKLVDESRKYQPNWEAMQHSHLGTFFAASIYNGISFVGKLFLRPNACIVNCRHKFGASRSEKNSRSD
ncbi:hypothetical protein ARMGADRAFT_125031 [Armillaria gallica]|uniref:Uncharacterized protein n=1 Tax=Armillaria gallica TaxID=47427 RepID=A0A2H3DHV9_ARMGA|nr:hypothetical protein ARMGADRAFT_125031 [Armillaria gallica]